MRNTPRGRGRRLVVSTTCVLVLGVLLVALFATTSGAASRHGHRHDKHVRCVVVVERHGHHRVVRRVVCRRTTPTTHASTTTVAPVTTTVAPVTTTTPSTQPCPGVLVNGQCIVLG